MPSLTSLCVFCGSRTGTNPNFAKVALELADTMVDRNIRLIYGGGGIGLMGVLARHIMEQGGEVVGVIPKFLQIPEVRYDGATRTIVTGSMHERKQTMFDLSDAFLVLPGGIGSLDETVEMMTWRQLRRHDKPIALLNLEDYWQPFKALLDHMIQEDFASQDVTDNLIVEGSIETALKAITVNLHS